MNKITKYLDPLNPFPSIIPSNLLDTIDEMFKGLDMYDPEYNSWQLTKGFPKGDVYIGDNGDAVVELALAGYDKDQLSVKVEDSKLVVAASKKEESSNRKNRALAHRAFTKEILFNKDFDLENTKVTYRNGLLRIVVPKLEGTSLSKQIEIE